MKPKHLSLAILASLLAGCGKEDHHARAPKAPDFPPIQVELGTAVSATDQATEETVGTVHARTVSIVSAKVSGRILSLESAIGKAVKEGDVLAEIDAAEIAARVDQAEAALKNAEQELARFKTLLEQKAVTQSEYDAVESRATIATASAKEAKTMLGYTKVLAPYDGKIARQLANIGDLAAPGRPLLEIESSGGLRFESDISEALAGKIVVGEKLRVKIEGLDKAIEATVAEIAPASNPLSRTLPVKLDLPETVGLRAGQFGRLSVPLEAGSNVRVPASSVLNRGQMEIVFVAMEDHAKMRLVKTGKRFGGEVEILSGVSDGETVIRSGHESIRDGQPIVTR
jgi:membrane fusion protein (multidrug efflux system)